MKKLLITFTIAVLSVSVFAEQWPLNVSYSSTNALGVTEIRGESAAGAAISAKDANDSVLVCFPFLGIVGEDSAFNCWGRDVAQPVTVTAQNSFLSQFSENTSNTITVDDLNTSGEPWPLTAGAPQTSFFGLTEVRGVSLQGAKISAVDANDASLFCLPLLGVVGEDGSFTCFGLGVSIPITIYATSSSSALFSDYTDASIVVDVIAQPDESEVDEPEV